MEKPRAALACGTLAGPGIELEAGVGRKEARCCWAKLLAKQELVVKEPAESYCSLDEGHFPFRTA